MPPRRPPRSIVVAAALLAGAGLAAALLSAGCPTRPKAPPLTNDAVYQNDAIGLRFLVPEGWSITSRADLPPGELSRPLILVAYMQDQPGQPGRPADLMLVAVDVPEDADVGRFLADHPIGPQKWRPAGAPQPLTVNGAAATRYALAAGPSRREATAFRRGGRVFAFLATFAASDTAARDAARRAVESATWSK